MYILFYDDERALKILRNAHSDITYVAKIKNLI